MKCINWIIDAKITSEYQMPNLDLLIHPFENLQSAIRQHDKKV